jgi:hypothetical protein
MAKRRGAKGAKIKHTKESPRPVDDASPLPERYKSFEYEGRWLGHGIERMNAEISRTGRVVGWAHINRLEASALDGLLQAGVLDDPKRDSGRTPGSRAMSTRQRRHAAGMILRELFEEAEIESSSTGHYDKVTNEMLPGGAPHPKSNNALNSEVEYHRLMRLCFPYHSVVRNVCCHNERPPTVVRDGQRRPCNWDEALRRALDIIADDKFPEAGRPRRSRARYGDPLPA